MEIVQLTFNPMQENTVLVSDSEKNLVIIDPGCYFREEKAYLEKYISDKGLKPVALLNTHAHLDHVMGNAFIKEKYAVDYYLHELDLPTLHLGDKSASLYGLNEFETSPEPDHFLHDGQHLSFGDITFEVIFGPGHAPGHVAFYNQQEGVLINGDILFKGSYGRVDLPGGNFQDLKSTIIDKLFKLPENTKVYCGHGPTTTIGEEKMNNPILW
ncbi:MAG: MBL fold metallo-hydrolase [Brumimicrobium sp.]|nr:MBL fold metallo-hydrolase [Brumimicrobium sp.]